MEAKTVFNNLVETCATELFQRHGVTLQAGALKGTPDRVAVIGFTGELMRGAFALAVTSELFEHVATPCGADDWLAECANQLLGRVKNRLLRYGAEVQSAIPVVLRGAQFEPMLAVAAGMRTDLWMHPFNGPAGPVCVWLVVKGAENLDLSLSDDPESMAPEPGESVFF